MIKIATITAAETYFIRISVLRKGKTLSECPFDGDDAPTTIHLGLFVDEILVGIVSVFKNSNTLFAKVNQYQIRGMAVLDSYQQLGYGKLLIKAAEKSISCFNNPLIWMNAREVAVPFYTKLQYEIVGAPFLIHDIGTHYLMKK